MARDKISSEIRNLYIYNEMKRALDKAAEQVKEQTIGNAFLAITKKVEILTVLRGFKYWDQIRDVDLLASALENLSYLRNFMPEKKKYIAEKIFNDILTIKTLEEGARTEKNAQTIKFWIQKTLNDIKEFKK
jgi:hypothetical protein